MKFCYKESLVNKLNIVNFFVRTFFYILLFYIHIYKNVLSFFINVGYTGTCGFGCSILYQGLLSDHSNFLLLGNQRLEIWMLDCLLGGDASLG